MKHSGKLSAGRKRAIVLIALCACLIPAAVILLNQTRPGSIATSPPVLRAPADPRTPESHSAPATAPAQPRSTPPNDGASAPSETGPVTAADLDYIAARDLLIPVAGVTANQLHDTFNQGRSEGRQHQALDIMAAQGTPVLAATDGVLLKLFQSDKGGITLYQIDPSRRYVYYYAHLMRYADGIAEGNQLHRGEVIAYVGDTGNAGAGNYHLHFAISKVTGPRQWSGGEPINPYSLLGGK